MKNDQLKFFGIALSAVVAVIALAVLFGGGHALSLTPSQGTVTGMESVYVSQPYTAQISLTSPVAPNPNYAGGSSTVLQAGTSVFDQNGNFLFKSPVQTLTDSQYAYSLSYTPQATGKMIVASVITSSSTQFFYNNGSWSAWSVPVVVASANKTVDVIAPSSPGAPSYDIFSGMLSFFGGLLCSIKQLFGQTC